MILKRYGSVSFANDVDDDMFIDLIEKAIERETDEKIWDLYLQDFLLSRFSGNPMISFEEYKKPPAKQEDEQSDEKIMDDSLNILMSISKPK
ncbi:hypothetical protein ACDX78_13445 [Virgibacillus oceani]